MGVFLSSGIEEYIQCKEWRHLRRSNLFLAYLSEPDLRTSLKSLPSVLSGLGVEYESTH